MVVFQMSVSLSNSALPANVSTTSITEKTLGELLDLALRTPEVTVSIMYFALYECFFITDV